MTDEEPKVMVQFRYEKAIPDVVAVAARFMIPVAAIDPDFGVIVTDEADKLCAVLVLKSVAKRIDFQLDKQSPGEGTFANPGIATFGPPAGDAEGEGGG